MVQGLFHPLYDVRLGQFPDLQREGYIFEDIHMGPDSEGLEHHPQSPLFRRHIDVLLFDGDGAAAQFDFPF